jgi:hypothetical protein
MCALAVVRAGEIEHFDFRFGRFARLRVGTAYLEGNVYVGPVIQEQSGGVSSGAGEAGARRQKRPSAGRDRGFLCCESRGVLTQRQRRVLC